MPRLKTNQFLGDLPQVPGKPDKTASVHAAVSAVAPLARKEKRTF